MRQLEKAATKDNLDAYMNRINENYATKKDTYALSAIIEAKAD